MTVSVQLDRARLGAERFGGNAPGVGFPRDDEGYDRFANAGLNMALAVNGMNSSNPEETMRAVMAAQESASAMYESIGPIVEARRAAGSEGDDLIGHLLRAEYEGDHLDDDQITIFLRSLLPAAADTTSRSWLNTMTCLLERPDGVRRGAGGRPAPGGDR